MKEIEIRTGIYGKEAVERFVQMVNIAKWEINIRASIADDGELIIKSRVKDFHSFVRRNLIRQETVFNIIVDDGTGNCGDKSQCLRFFGEKLFSKSARYCFHNAGLGYETKTCDRILYGLLAGFTQKSKSSLNGYSKEQIDEVIGKPLDPIQAFRNKIFKGKKLMELENINAFKQKLNTYISRTYDKIDGIVNDIDASKDEAELNNNKLRFKELQDFLVDFIKA